MAVATSTALGIASLVVAAGGTTYAGVSQNQAIQRQKGAAQAAQTQADAERKAKEAIGPAQAIEQKNAMAPDQALLNQKRRIAAIQNGIMSTVGKADKGTGSTTTPPAAYASGKGLLGQ